MQVIQDTTAGGRLGESIGQGLQQLAQYKLDAIQGPYQRALERQEFSRGIEPLLGPDVTKFLASLDPAARKSALQNLGPLVELARQGGIQGIMGQGQNQPAMGQQPGQQVPQQQGMQPGLNPSQDTSKILEDIFTPPAVKIQKEMLELKKMKTLEPELKKIRTEGEDSRSLKKWATEALDIVNKQKAKTGIWGKITPEVFQSPEGQVLKSLLDRIVIEKAKQGKGVASQLRLGLEQGAKASIWQHPKAIAKILEDTINDPELMRKIARDEARGSLEEKFGGSLPRDLITQIDKLAGNSVKSSSKKEEESLTKDTLPSAKKLPKGAKARNPFTGKVQYIVKDGKWEEYNG